jgi:hypothetical protein
MNTTLAILAIVCLMLAIIGAFRKDPGTAAAGTVGAVLFTALSLIVGNKDRCDRDC